MLSRRFLPCPGRRTVALCVLVGALLLAGCSGITSDEPELPDGEAVVEQFTSVGVYNATLTVETTAGNRTTEIRAERTIRPTTGEYYEVSVIDGNRTITVSNGTTQWLYRPEQNTVTVVKVDGEEQLNRTDQLRQLFDSIGTDQESSRQILPIVPRFTAAADSDDSSTLQTDRWSDPLEVSYEGTETVAGREAYVITLESVEGGERQVEQTLYLDTEWFVFLQMEWEIEAERDGERERTTGRMTFETVEFDPTVNEELFEFEPPANATVRRIGDHVGQFRNYSAVVRESDQPVPEPQVPADFEFERGTVTTEAVNLQYTDGTSTLYVARRTTDEEINDGEEIGRDGRTYYYRDRGAGNSLQWACGDAIYSVAGELDREGVLDVASSVRCPTTTDD